MLDMCRMDADCLQMYAVSAPFELLLIFKLSVNLNLLPTPVSGPRYVREL